MLRGFPCDDVAVVLVDVQDRDVAGPEPLNSSERCGDQLPANVVSLVLESYRSFMKIDGPRFSSAPLVASRLTQCDLCGPDDRGTAAIVERQTNGFNSRGVRQLAEEFRTRTGEAVDGLVWIADGK
jgi:hypothetical protein